ncbi:aldehyde dehydrogenase [Capsulimonas corticalis]|uniref:Aldehyde dehydrogenase n=1 Tax=Capsulimonas corticalis TaxID=2219043 RepID=A0A402CSQ6_9BACT|nr:aldehyde dehydrogenase family protein [Capsulimonas corticalis]BDI31016.1 aldehyde dehydrogenase [Capsulimonas corticalis]
MNSEVRSLYIASQWRATSEVDTIVSPWDGTSVGHLYRGAVQEMEDAIAAAYAAREPFRALTDAVRGGALDKIHAGLVARAEEIAVTIAREAGKPIRDARGEVGRAVHTFQIAAEEARRFGQGEQIPLDRIESSQGRIGITRRFPSGVVGAITPFNFPLNLVAHKVAPALAVGAPVVLKPAHQTPLTALLLAEVIAEAGLPVGAFNVIHTEPALGERLALDPRVAVLSFTGSARIGWELKAKANRKRVTLELGGNAATIVHEDADLEMVVPKCVASAFAYAGQVCISTQRLLVHRPIFDAFTQRFVALSRDLRLGDPLDETADLGPVITEAGGVRILECVREALDGGARLLLGDIAPADPRRIAPIILTDTNTEMKAEREEIFGPVVTLTPYDDFEEALDRANDSDYGLQTGVFTNDIHRIYRAFDRLEVGGVIANDTPSYRVDHMPYGGVKGSGFGREGVRYAMEEMSELRLLALNLS